MKEVLEITGIYPADFSIIWDRRSPRQSGVINIGDDNILLVRETGFHINQVLNGQEEIKRRADAIILHQRILPEFTLDYQPVVLQGFKSAGEVLKSVAVFAKLTEKLTDIQKLKDMKTDEILGDKELCDKLSKIYFRQFQCFLIGGKYFDNFGFGEIGQNWSPILQSLFRPLQPNNVMVGYDRKGNRRVFADPDWYLTQDELKEKIERLNKDGIEHTSIIKLKYHLLKSAIFYKIASIIS